MSAHVLDRLSAYLDGELSPPDRALVAEHLAGCEECSRRLQALTLVDAAARELPAEPPRGYFSSFPGRVRRRLEGDTRGRSWRVPAWTWAAAAAALLAVVAPLTLLRVRSPAGSIPEEKAPRDLYNAPTPPASPAGVQGEKALRALGYAATPPAAASPAKPAPGPAELQAPMARPETRAEGSVGTPSRAVGGAELSAEVLAQAGRAAASPGAPPPPPSLLAENRAPEARAAFGAPAQAPPPEKDEVKPAAGAELARRESGTAPLESPRPAASEDRGVKAKGQLEPAPPEAALKRAAPSPPVDAERLYRSLLFRSAQTLAEARDLREAWRSYSRLHPEGAPADEARVRVVETGAQAYRLGSYPDDLARVREDARAYLGRQDAVQAARVRAVLEELGLQP
jgi:anti-sigma factor RsiW